KVKPKPGFVTGDVIPNTAQIYFDFNPAIVTNTFETTFVSQLDANEFQNGEFTFYPNPANSIVTISMKNSADTISSIAVYDVTGKMILSQKGNFATEQLDVSAIAKGMYLLDISSAN